MPPLQLNAAIEALLFSSDQPLPVGLMSEALETSTEEVLAGLRALGQLYSAREAGVELREIAGGWMLVTTAAQAEWVGRLLRGKRKMRLSRAALETMAIIAYKQPVTKSEVEAIRGVDSSGVLATLMERNLVTIRGRSKVVGRPLLYGTTQEFLEYFGLRDLGELPRPEELRALVAAREPEQLEMMELEVVSKVASDLAAAEAARSSNGVPLPLEAEPMSEDEREAAAAAEPPGEDDVEDEDQDEFEDDDDLEEDELEADGDDGDEEEEGEGEEGEEDDEDEDEDEEEDDVDDDGLIDDELYAEEEYEDDEDDEDDDEDLEDDEDSEQDEDEPANRGGRSDALGAGVAPSKDLPRVPARRQSGARVPAGRVIDEGGRDSGRS